MIRPGDAVGPYILMSKLGRGAFGVVWLAERRTSLTTTKVALKMPLDDDVDLEAVKQEAELWVKASGHPNVLPIIEANIYDSQVIIASEYAPDGSLDNWLNKHRGSAPSINAAAEMTMGILNGLDHLHKRQIIHRDLKPANLLLQGDMPRLADFGISRVLKSTSQSNLAAGTPGYMAPEAFDGKRNEQTDIWSAGVILYQMISGSLPFPQGDLTSLVGAILTRNPDPLPISVPKPLHSIIKCALEKNTGKRYRSVGDMRADLRNAMEYLQARHNQGDLASTFRAGAEPAYEIQSVGSYGAAVKPAKAAQESPEVKIRTVVPRSAYVVITLLALAIIFVGVVFMYKLGVISSPNKEPQPVTNPTTTGSNTRGLKRYTGMVGTEGAVFNLIWNNDNTISGNYYLSNNPKVIYSVMGTNHEQGVSELSIYEGSASSGIMKLYKTIEGDILCWQGTFYASSSGERNVRFCRNR